MAMTPTVTGPAVGCVLLGRRSRRRLNPDFVHGALATVSESLSIEVTGTNNSSGGDTSTGTTSGEYSDSITSSVTDAGTCLTYTNSLGDTLSNNGAFGASDNYASVTDDSGGGSTEINIGSSSEGGVVDLSWSYQSDVVESGGGTVTTTYGSEGGAALPDAWRSVPATRPVRRVAVRHQRRTAGVQDRLLSRHNLPAVRRVRTSRAG